MCSYERVQRSGEFRNRLGIVTRIYLTFESGLELNDYHRSAIDTDSCRPIGSTAPLGFRRIDHIEDP